MKNFTMKLAQCLCSIAVLMSTIAVNTTCNARYYQEEMPTQLDSLRRYHVTE